MASQRPFIVIVPGASQNPAHYGYLSHLLQLAGYPVFSAPLPSIGASGNVTAQDDTDYIREKMLLPVLDHEEHDVILFMHSYSSVPGSAAAKGLSKSERVAQGKKTAVIGQVYLSSIFAKGGDGGNIVGAFGGGYPPHIRADVSTQSLFNHLSKLTFSLRLKQIFFAVMIAFHHFTKMFQRALLVQLQRLRWLRA